MRNEYVHYAAHHYDPRALCGMLVVVMNLDDLVISRLEEQVTCPNCLVKLTTLAANEVIANSKVKSKLPSDTVEELITGRRSVYGDPEVTFQEHAAMFTVILNRKLKPGEQITPEEVVMLMMGYKLVRAIQAPGYSDNIDDVVGYADIFKLVQGDRFIQARTVDEYLEKKAKLDGQPEQA